MGGSASRSDSTSASEGWGLDESLAESFGFSRNDSSGFSKNESFSESQGGSFVFGAQQPYLKDLYASGAQFANPGQAQARAGRLTRSFMPGLKRDFRSLGGMVNPNQQIRAETASLKAGLGSMFRNEINPAIESEAIAAGGFGGGRQGAAQGVATGQLADAFAKGRGDIVTRANANAQAAAALRADLGGNIYNLGMNPTMAAFGPLAAYADLLGGPTVLSRQTSTGGSTGTSRQKSAGRSGDRSVAKSRGYNEYGSWARSGSKSVGFDFG